MSKDGVDPPNGIPVLRPRLPSAEDLLPYLRRIDENRVYANWGPLVTELEVRLSREWGLEAPTTTVAASGTAALVGTILATAGPARHDRPYALMPALTFSATAVAAELCGYRPYLSDVDPEEWMLSAERVAEHPMLDHVGVVVPVGAFGRPVSQEPWLDLRRRTGVPVVIDASASFDRILDAPDRCLGRIPVVISLHATKTFGTGEGGCVVCTDGELLADVVRALNYGFSSRRESEAPSLNGKMSEYSAAVGLASLDRWPETIGALRDVAARYRAAFDGAAVPGRLVVSPEVSACYALLESTRGQASQVEETLRRSGIDYRHWYGDGLHRQPQFAGAPRDDLSTTEDLAPRLIGLPLAPDLADETIARVARALGSG